MTERTPYTELINGNMPPWVMRFVKGVGKTINEYSMIRADEKILLGVSGGKDSLALALALSLRRRWLPVSYKLSGLMINWIEHPIEESKRDELYTYFDRLGIDFKIVDEQMYSEGFKGDFNCYLCSRNRRRILFSTAAEQGYRTVAMGHHLDDLVETSMMNLFFRGTFNTMLPVQEFFDGKLYIVRPLIQTHENVLVRLSQAYDLPVVKPVCPYDRTNIRSSLKPIVKEFTAMDRNAREHVFSAHNLSTGKPELTD